MEYFWAWRINENGVLLSKWHRHNRKKKKSECSLRTRLHFMQDTPKIFGVGLKSARRTGVRSKSLAYSWRISCGVSSTIIKVARK